MANAISVYSTVTQADQFLVEVPENSLLQVRYFPTRKKDEFEAKEVLLDFDDADLKAGAFCKKGYINGDTTSWRASVVEPPRIGISDTIDPTDNDRLLFEQLCYAQGVEDPSRAEAFDDLKRVKAGRLAKRVERAIEKSCVSVLLNNGIQGTIPTSSTDPTPMEINIQYFDGDPLRGTGNQQRYIPAYPWGNGSATPYKPKSRLIATLFGHPQFF